MRRTLRFAAGVVFALMVFGFFSERASVAFGQAIIISNPAPASYDYFGADVAAFGNDRVLIGAYDDSLGATNTGTAYLFGTNGTLLMTFPNPTPAVGDAFGCGVAMAGLDRVLIGSCSGDAGVTNAGAAYLFNTNGVRLITFTNPSPNAGDLFGFAVAGVGVNRVLIGAPQEQNGGAAYLFNTNGALVTTITNPSPGGSDSFGIAVAGFGAGRMIIGAYREDLPLTDAGAAYLFSTNGTRLMTFTNPAPTGANYFGLSVAAVGTDRVLIGAPDASSPGVTRSGAAYLFDTNGTHLVTFTNPTPATGDSFGTAVAALGSDRVIISAQYDDTTALGAGAAYLFSTNGTLLTTYVSPSPLPQASFGSSVAGVGTNGVLVGAGADSAAGTQAGAAYLFGANIRPVITTEPEDLIVPRSNDASFAVGATGTLPVSYQWRFNGVSIAGATNFAYTRTNAQFSHAGNYTVVITNMAGSVTSAVAVLTVSSFSDAGMDLSGVLDGSVAWGDYDNDGRLDALLTGRTGVNPHNPISEVWRNTGTGFTNIAAGLPGVENGSAAWGDYDNDGRLDILLSGTDASNAPLCQLWRNTGAGFAPVLNAGLPQVQSGCAVWGDYDSDGWTDIFITGRSATGNKMTQVWRNTGGALAERFVQINTSMAGVDQAAAAWADYNDDRRLDILVTGSDTNSQPLTQLWRNTGSGFALVDTPLPDVERGAVAWGDYDNDGVPDLLLTGTTNGLSSGAIAQVWRNTGKLFTNINAGLPGVSQGSVAWADYDNDGRLDLALFGAGTNSGKVCQIWRNTGNGFSNINAGLPAVSAPAVAWGDYDNDGRLDILVTGYTNALTDLVSQIWRNDSTIADTAPSTPTGLSATISGTNLVLSWIASADQQMPSAGLTYNLRIGGYPGGENVMSPMASGTGFRRVAQSGNAGGGLTAILPLRFGQTNYCSVQAVDAAFMGSTFSAEVSVKVLQWQAPPIIVPLGATNLMVGDINGNGVLDANELNSVLTNYYASSPFLQMTNVAGLGGSNVTFALSNSLLGVFSVEYTTNLTDWLPLGPATPRYLFTDTNAPAGPQRYYRLRLP